MNSGKKQMKRSDIVRTIQVQFKRLNQADADAMLNTIINEMHDTLAAGERVEIRGFGTLRSRLHAPKATTHPRTGKPLRLPARRNVHFRPSPELTKKMNDS